MKTRLTLLQIDLNERTLVSWRNHPADWYKPQWFRHKHITKSLARHTRDHYLVNQTALQGWIRMGLHGKWVGKLHCIALLFVDLGNSFCCHLYYLEWLCFLSLLSIMIKCCLRIVEFIKRCSLNLLIFLLLMIDDFSWSFLLFLFLITVRWALRPKTAHPNLSKWHSQSNDEFPNGVHPASLRCSLGWISILHHNDSERRHENVYSFFLLKVFTRNLNLEFGESFN